MTDVMWQTAAAPASVEIESEDPSFVNLAVSRVSGREAISELFRFELTLVSTVQSDLQPPVDPSAMVGAALRLRMVDGQGNIARVIEGMVASARMRAGVRAIYELTLVPQAFQLTLVTTQAVFQELTVPELITRKLEQHNIQHEFRLVENYPKREFFVQFDESDLAFVSRLAEHVGISFHFEQGDEGAVMVWSDHQSAFAKGTEVVFAPRGEAASVFELSTLSRAVPIVYGANDYNYRKPKIDLGETEDLSEGVAGGVVEYGGVTNYGNQPEEDETARRAAVRAQAARIQAREFEGKAVIAGFRPGARLRLDGHPFHSQLELLLTEVRHLFVHNLGAGSEPGCYENEFLAAPEDYRFRPARKTPAPRVSGLLSAVVEGRPGSAPEDTSAYLDELGRYTVQFHFDTDAASAPRGSSLPIRLMQPFAGPSQGMHFPLRPGTEVLVAFVDGDLDRPVIVGAVPNEITPSPVTSKDAHMHRIASHHGLLIEFGRTR